jgi:ribonuclease BN (tRNA processing enzyme)
VTIWGPPTGGPGLRERVGRYISNPLSPIDIRELPAMVSFRDALPGRWQIGGVEVKAALVAHRGPTLGYRLEADGSCLCYLPDHEPALAQNLATSNVAWISGHGLAREASMLVHDCQYTDREYRGHRGWGHSSVADALSFADRARPQRLVLFHHDPAHDDAQLDAIGDDARKRWERLGGEGPIELAREGRTFALAG